MNDNLINKNYSLIFWFQITSTNKQTNKRKSEEFFHQNCEMNDDFDHNHDRILFHRVSIFQNFQKRKIPPYINMTEWTTKTKTKKKRQRMKTFTIFESNHAFHTYIIRRQIKSTKKNLRNTMGKKCVKSIRAVGKAMRKKNRKFKD